MDPITRQAFTPGQQDEINTATNALIRALVQVAPQLGPQFLSGGTLEVKTMSGLHVKLTFGPQAGGLILPGGIRPAGQNGSIIK